MDLALKQTQISWQIKSLIETRNLLKLMKSNLMIQLLGASMLSHSKLSKILKMPYPSKLKN